MSAGVSVDKQHQRSYNLFGNCQHRSVLQITKLRAVCKNGSVGLAKKKEEKQMFLRMRGCNECLKVYLD